MNRLEGQAKPLLMWMIRGRHIVLSPSDQLTLARWIVAKVMVCEHADDQLAVTPPDEKRAFAETLTIPPYYRVYVGAHSTDTDVGYMRTSSTATVGLEGPIPPLNGMRRNLQQVSLLVGRLFIHVNAVRLDNFSIEKCAPIPAIHNFMRIWPLQCFQFTWPGTHVLGQADLATAANSWDDFRKSARWGGDIPDDW